jgi:hypothetical protein
LAAQLRNPFHFVNSIWNAGISGLQAAIGGIHRNDAHWGSRKNLLDSFKPCRGHFIISRRNKMMTPVGEHGTIYVFHCSARYQTIFVLIYRRHSHPLSGVFRYQHGSNPLVVSHDLRLMPGRGGHLGNHQVDPRPSCLNEFDQLFQVIFDLLQ